MDTQAGLPTDGTTADLAPTMVQLKVVHGHLAFSKYPVVVGHYNGDTFAGAEAQLDRALERRLSQRRSLGLYPGPLGSNTIVLDDTQKPRGAVVVGLGEAASLSLGGLRRTLRQGILALAAAEIDRHRMPSDTGENADRPEVPISFSALVVGSGDGGLDRTTCITALLQAAAEAGSVFKEIGDLKARLATIEIVELLEYRAFAIWHIVNEVLKTQSNLGELFTCEPEVAKRRGGRRRVYAARDKSWWEPIQISMSKSADGERSLAFAVAGGLARAELRTIAADLDVVEPLMRRAIKSSAPDGANATPGRALFELLWPSSLKDQSMEERNRRLVLDEESAQFPWELLDDRRPWAEDSHFNNGNQRPPVVRYGLVRQLLQTRFQQHVVVPTGTPKALIIGNPRGAAMPEGLRDLQGAEAEAGAIRELLKSTHEVTILTGREATPENVCEQLFAQAWEIVHISAHGVVRTVMAGPDGRQKPMTGVVLGGGVVLGPSVLSKIPVGPGIFFLNCCHLGHIDPTAEEQAQQAALTTAQPELAASLAVQLMKNGVRAVVAAGWAVQDTVAQAFGTAFYDAMLNGSGFGEATLAARRVAYRENPNGTTWGAYQCYGDPDYTLPGKRPISSHVASDDSTRSFVASVEAIAEIEQLGDEVNIGLERNVDAQKARLARIEAAAGKWLDNGELRVALAEAYGDLCDLPKAIEHYEAARIGADSQYKVKAIEQLANLMARQATISFRNNPTGAPDVPVTIGKIEAARTLIENLIKALGPTSERLSIEGGCWKRLAQVEKARTDEYLKHMAEAYQRAADFGAREKSSKSKADSRQLSAADGQRRAFGRRSARRRMPGRRQGRHCSDDDEIRRRGRRRFLAAHRSDRRPDDDGDGGGIDRQGQRRPDAAGLREGMETRRLAKDADVSRRAVGLLRRYTEDRQSGFRSNALRDRQLDQADPRRASAGGRNDLTAERLNQRWEEMIMSKASSYIGSLDLPAPQTRDVDIAKTAAEFTSGQQALVIDTHLAEFKPAVGQALRPTISYGLLLGQLAAEKAIANGGDTKQWFTTYNSVMGNSGWVLQTGEFAKQELSDTNVALHKAIIPVLALALGPAAAAGSIILKALEGLQSMDQDSPWLTLFQEKCQTVTGAKFGVSVVDAGPGGGASLQSAYFSIEASQKITQILFLKIATLGATMNGAKSSLSIADQVIADTKDALQKKVAPFIVSNIENVEI